MNKPHPDAIVSLISTVREHANAYIAAALAERGVKDILPAHGSVLYALLGHSPMQMSELATRIHRKKNTVTGLISTLERNGYCRREADPKDARAQLIYITEKTEALAPLMDEISQELAERTDYESEAYHRLMVELNEVNDSLVLAQSESPEESVERTLTGLGFKKSEFGRKTETFSQGWNMRIELAKILLRHPDVLLLDEPTNHLDIESIQWLEDYLTSFKGAVIIVTHDRYFLDAVIGKRKSGNDGCRIVVEGETIIFAKQLVALQKGILKKKLVQIVISTTERLAMDGFFTCKKAKLAFVLQKTHTLFS